MPTLICALFFMFLTCEVEAWFTRWPSSGSRRRSFKYGVKSKSKLTNIYNSKVVSIQRVTRPLQGYDWLAKIGIKHAGVIVTTSNGKRWLIHKGKGFGRSSQIVVVDPSVMSNKWTYGPVRKVTGGVTIGQYVKVGGKYYNWLINNCLQAASRMCKIAR